MFNGKIHPMTSLFMKFSQHFFPHLLFQVVDFPFHHLTTFDFGSHYTCKKPFKEPCKKLKLNLSFFLLNICNLKKTITVKVTL